METSDNASAAACRLNRADDLAAFADLLAWQRAGTLRRYDLRGEAEGVSVTLCEFKPAHLEVGRSAPTVAKAIRAALAAWGYQTG